MVRTRSGFSTDAGHVLPAYATYDNGDPPSSIEHFLHLIMTRSNGQHSKLDSESTAQNQCSNCSNTGIEYELVLNQYDNMIRVPTLRTSDHNALDLSRILTTNLELDLEHSSPDKISAHAELHLLANQNSPRNLFARLGAPDARAVYKHEMEHLLNTLSDIFFPTRMRFTFAYYPQDAEDLYGDCLVVHESFEQKIIALAQIRLHSTYRSPMLIKADKPRTQLTHDDIAHETALERLGTLLHELCHAYIGLYACPQCSYGEDVRNFAGHGRAWQRVATSVELKCEEMLGLKLDLGRFEAIQYNWERMKYWPTVAEVRSWRLTDEQYGR